MTNTDFPTYKYTPSELNWSEALEGFDVEAYVSSLIEECEREQQQSASSVQESIVTTGTQDLTSIWIPAECDSVENHVAMWSDNASLYTGGTSSSNLIGNEDEHILDLKLGTLSVILFDSSSRIRTRDSCYLVSSTFLFRVLAASDIVDNVLSPVGKVYNIYDRNVSISLT